MDAENFKRMDKVCYHILLLALVCVFRCNCIFLNPFTTHFPLLSFQDRRKIVVIDKETRNSVEDVMGNELLSLALLV